MAVDRSLISSEPLSDASRSLRTVLDLLLQDRALKPIAPEALPWGEPIFVLRSAPVDRLRVLLDEIVAHTKKPVLHIMSHAQDEQAIHAMAPCAFTFHPYPEPGPYRLEGIVLDDLERLRSIAFGTLFFLDAGTTGERLEDVERMVAGIRKSRAVSFRGDGTFASMPDWHQRTLAESAFLQLIEWYHFKLDPGFPDGPVLAADAVAKVLSA